MVESKEPEHVSGVSGLTKEEEQAELDACFDDEAIDAFCNTIDDALDSVIGAKVTDHAFLCSVLAEAVKVPAEKEEFVANLM
jgi:hypothetical protein